MIETDLTEEEIKLIKKILIKKPMSASEIRSRTGLDYYKIVMTLESLENKEFERIKKRRGYYWRVKW